MSQDQETYQLTPYAVLCGVLSKYDAIKALDALEKRIREFHGPVGALILDTTDPDRPGLFFSQLEATHPDSQQQGSKS